MVWVRPAGRIARLLGVARFIQINNSFAISPQEVFSVRQNHPQAGLVQQTVQIVAAHDLTLFVGHHAIIRMRSLAQVPLTL